MRDIKNELAQCKRKLTLLEKRGLDMQNEEYRYWYERLGQIEEIQFRELIRDIESQYGEICLERKIIASGALQVTAYTTSGRYIQHINQKLIPARVMESIPLTSDYRANNPPCIVCGESGTELHHWAPRHLFEDYDGWPTSYLCKTCHDRWHNTILGHWRTGNGCHT